MNCCELPDSSHSASTKAAPLTGCPSTPKHLPLRILLILPATSSHAWSEPVTVAWHAQSSALAPAWRSRGGPPCTSKQRPDNKFLIWPPASMDHAWSVIRQWPSLKVFSSSPKPTHKLVRRLIKKPSALRYHWSSVWFAPLPHGKTPTAPPSLPTHMSKPRPGLTSPSWDTTKRWRWFVEQLCISGVVPSALAPRQWPLSRGKVPRLRMVPSVMSSHKSVERPPRNLLQVSRASGEPGLIVCLPTTSTHLPVMRLMMKPSTSMSHTCAMGAARVSTQSQSTRCETWKVLAPLICFASRHLQLFRFFRKPCCVYSHRWSVSSLSYSQGHSTAMSPFSVPGLPLMSKQWPLSWLTMKPSDLRCQVWSLSGHTASFMPAERHRPVYWLTSMPCMVKFQDCAVFTSPYWHSWIFVGRFKLSSGFELPSFPETPKHLWLCLFLSKPSGVSSHF
mmetsp:Transcript_7494/g.20987  ORF Transcript_7494/g.20987 Transcript_7494/m.20987 type:complete len:448 (-) Transcript_7494:255-1598(-)